MSAPQEHDALALAVRGLDAGYGNATVLSSIDLAVGAGQTVGLVGPNGVGKSTLLKAIAGQVRVTAGEITYGDRRIDGKSVHAIAKAGIVLVPEGRQMFGGLSVSENLWLGSFVRGADSEMEDTVYELFPRLYERRQQLAGSLSGGEQQMVAIGRGLMSRSSVLMIDEPTLGLAPILIEEVVQTLMQVRSQLGITMINAEQRLNLIRSLCEQIHVIVGGRIAHTSDASISDEAVMSFYIDHSA